ncbi:hypothetical protein FJ434_16480 [Mesorhizobium sp. B2-5-13]|uniref:hypothetical protein n=1 Tax=unclassified Mesorhizobium TaxID=325217 RepID=UPI00112DADD7|nr:MULTISPECIES: hypothetical protein [unclassified Mesorhizobium]TPJ85521.1 hypothetical protein FJ434_16480 [Mesorhizobium sp. B2-5-13]TPK39267.1 hypothetical protein FJ560_29380 [Mesorhizobium sp. B2-5-5]
MSKTALSAAELKSADRQAPEIDPAGVTLQSTGFAWREYLVRVPADFVADDLKLPEVWRKLQTGSRNGLKKFDHLFIVAFDESWLAEAIVASADGKGAVLCKPRITTMPERYDKLFSDGTYRIEWNGFGFVTVRIRDGHVMTQPVPNAALAERLLAQLYPARVA